MKNRSQYWTARLCEQGVEPVGWSPIRWPTSSNSETIFRFTRHDSSPTLMTFVFFCNRDESTNVLFIPVDTAHPSSLIEPEFHSARVYSVILWSG